MGLRSWLSTETEILAFMFHDTGIPFTATGAYPYKEEGSSDDDFDDGAVSLMSRMSRMTHEKGL